MREGKKQCKKEENAVRRRKESRSREKKNWGGRENFTIKTEIKG